MLESAQTPAYALEIVQAAACKKGLRSTLAPCPAYDSGSSPQCAQTNEQHPVETCLSRTSGTYAATGGKETTDPLSAKGLQALR